jgi:hypothetical protein
VSARHLNHLKSEAVTVSGLSCGTRPVVSGLLWHSAQEGTAMAKEENSRDVNETDRPLEDDVIGAAEDEDFDDEDDLDDDDDEDDEGEV